jgi:excinuclease ABC subunit A
MEKPDVDRIDGICPSIAIRQKNSVRNPRSTVGTVTEIHDYMRLLFARVGRTFCRQCGREVIRETAEVVATELLRLPESTRLIVGFDLPLLAMSAESAARSEEAEEAERARLDRAPDRPTYAKRTIDVGDDALETLGLTSSTPPPWRTMTCRTSRRALRCARRRLPRAPAQAALFDPHHLCGSRRDAVRHTLDALRRKGFGRLLIGGHAVSIDDVDPATLGDRPTLSVVVDRLRVEGDLRARLTDSIETAYAEGGGAAWAIELPASGGEPIAHAFSERFECRRCRITYEDPQPRLFSFNNPFGACPTCHGFGNIIELDMDLVVPDPSKSISRCDRAVEQAALPIALAELKRTAKARHPARRRVAEPHRRRTPHRRRR